MSKVWVNTELVWGNRRQTDHLEGAGTDGKKTWNASTRNRMGCVDWIDL